MKRAKKSSKAEAVGRSGQTDCSPCFAWMQELRMSMQRFVEIRGEMQNKLSGEEYHYFFRYIPDGNKAHLFVGEEQQVRKLAKNMAKKWNVSSWRLVPMPRWNFVYSGAPAFRDDSLCLLRHPSENDKTQPTSAAR